MLYYIKLNYNIYIYIFYIYSYERISLFLPARLHIVHLAVSTACWQSFAMQCCPHSQLGHSSWVLAWSRCLNLEGAGLEWRKDVTGVNFGPELARLLREACADLGWNILIFGEPVFFMFSSIKLQIETPGGLEHRNCMKQPMLQIQARCRVATQT